MIDPIDNSQRVYTPELKAPEKNVQEPNVREDGLEITKDVQKQEALVAKLASIEDEVRPDVVAAGKTLANDSNFPNSDDLDQLARALLSPIISAE